VLHVANLHHLRRGSRDNVKWNYACDFVVNPIVRELHFKLPEGLLEDARYENMSAEQVYDKLPDPPKSYLNIGGVVAPKNKQGKNLSPSELAEAEAAAKVMVQQAAQVAKMQGNLPGQIARMVEELCEPVIPWRQVLARFVQERVKNDYSWAVPNMRYIARGIYLPAPDGMELGTVLLLVDTSGSISVKDLNVFASEIHGITEAFSARLEVLYVDTEVAKHETFEPGEEVELRPRGCGGTDFRPGFIYAEKHGIEPICAIYYTDGYCDDFPDEPDYPLLWAVYDNHSFDPPIGDEVLEIRHED